MIRPISVPILLTLFLVSIFILYCTSPAPKEISNYPDPEHNPLSPLMLAADWIPDNSHNIDFSKLPRVPSEHVLVSDVRNPAEENQKDVNKETGGVNQHNYLIYHDGQFWIMWSDGPSVEDKVGQRVKYATSIDGLQWSKPEFITPIPPNSGKDSEYYDTRSDKGFR